MTGRPFKRLNDIPYSRFASSYFIHRLNNRLSIFSLNTLVAKVFFVIMLLRLWNPMIILFYKLSSSNPLPTVDVPVVAESLEHHRRGLHNLYNYINIGVDSLGVMSLQGQAIVEDSLSGALKIILADFPQAYARLIVDKNTPMERVHAIIYIVKESGCSNYLFEVRYDWQLYNRDKVKQRITRV